MEGDHGAAPRSSGSEPDALAGVLIPRMVPTEGLQPPTFGLQNRCTGAVLCRPNGVTGGTRIHFGRLHRAPPRLLRLPSHSTRRHRRSLVLPRSNTRRPSRSIRGRAGQGYRRGRSTRSRASSYYNGGALRGRTACSVFAERRLHRLACAPRWRVLKDLHPGYEGWSFVCCCYTKDPMAPERGFEPPTARLTISSPYRSESSGMNWSGPRGSNSHLKFGRLRYRPLYETRNWFLRAGRCHEQREVTWPHPSTKELVPTLCTQQRPLPLQGSVQSIYTK